MKLDTVHRITGRHMFLTGPGVAIWGKANVVELAQLQQRIAAGLKALGWSADEHKTIVQEHGFVIAMRAPVDQLYTACSLLEWAAGKVDSLALVLAEQEQERNAKWEELYNYARTHCWPVFDDEDGLTIGYGTYAKTWALDQLPEPNPLLAPAEQGGHIPVAYVTGTNGKTTTSRMLAAIAQAAGFTPGMTSSDGVTIGGDWEVKGDWTGPGAARKVLRHPDVDFAVLETARGGLMRRGLVIDNADCAVVTNVSADHLGYWGLHSVDDMARAKLTVCLGVREQGAIVLNADCEVLLQAWNNWPDRPSNRLLLTFSSKNQDGNAYLQEGHLWLSLAGERRPLMKVKDIPLGIAGAAIHNLENAMAAALVAASLGIADPEIAKGLSLLKADPHSSQGRSNLFHCRGAQIFLDFAHNEDGMARVVEMAKRMPAKRRLLVLGQAGADEILILYDRLLRVTCWTSLI